jgi:V/A-type H+-transporting ATPase subunit G/H
LALEVVKEIREAEVEGENLYKQAVNKSKEIIKSAENEAAKKMDSARKEAGKIADGISKIKEEEARVEAESILASAAQECTSIGNLPAEKVDRAVNFVIERIVKSYVSS